MKDQIEDIFKPKENTEEEIFRAIEIVKSAIGTKQTTVSIFTMVLDSIKNKGIICKINEEEDDKKIVELSLEV